MLWKLLS